MLCAVCESESFTQDDTGFYICDACGTQSQDFRQEVSEVDINELGTYRRSRRFAAPVAQQSMDDADLLADIDDKSKIFAAMQFILQQQVNTLIKVFKVNPKLRNVVGQLWFDWIQKAGLADFKSSTNNTNESGTSQHTLNQDNNGDDGVNESDDENENEAENDEENPETLMENLKNIQKQQSLQININKSASQLLQSPKLHYTLAILFIGCYWLREPILLTDILQGAERGTIPYLSAYLKLPKMIKLTLKILKFIRPKRVPLTHHVFRTTKSFLKVFNLFDLPDWSPAFAIQRFVNELNLPEILNLHVLNLIKLYPLSLTISESQFVHPEVYVMALIALAVKLHLGLDDKMKQQQQQQQQQQQIPLDENSSLFFWSDWVHYMRTKLASPSNRNFLDFDCDLSSLSSKDEGELLKFVDEHIFTGYAPPKGLEEIITVFKSIGEEALNESKERENSDLSLESKMNFSQTQFPSISVDATSSDDSNSGTTTSSSSMSDITDTSGNGLNYVHYQHKDLIGDYHDPYNFLLTACSFHAMTTPRTLHNIINSIEIKMLAFAEAMEARKEKSTT